VRVQASLPPRLSGLDRGGRLLSALRFVRTVLRRQHNHALGQETHFLTSTKDSIVSHVIPVNVIWLVRTFPLFNFFMVRILAGNFVFEKTSTRIPSSQVS
jgi:hypothetical protein